MSSEYSITRRVGKRRGRRKARVVSPVIGQPGCPGREPDCLKPAGICVGVSARMYNDSNLLGDRAKEGRGSEGRHTGTGEGISACIHVANSHADRAEDGCRSDCRHSANSLWERLDSCMTVGASIIITYAGGRGEGMSLSTGGKRLEIDKNQEKKGQSIHTGGRPSGTPLTAPIGRYTNWDFCHV